MLNGLFGPILNALHGFDLCVAIIIIAICLFVWLLVGAKNKKEKKQLIKQVVAVFILIILAVIIIGIHHLIPEQKFPNNIAGILVVKIAGDDDGSLQRALVNSLNERLANDTNSQPIEVWADNNVVDEKQGLAEAHDLAREFGKKRHALLVVWGSKAGDMRFFPRITIVPDLATQGNRTLKVQDIRELELPPETVNQPIYIAHILVGAICYISNEYEEALRHFSAAIQMNQGTGEETAGLHMIVGATQCGLAQNTVSSSAQLKNAIENLSLAANFYEQKGIGCSWLVKSTFG